ncbi:hypothetical protein NDU88_000889 [Pleurodeles waltl]|uniref:Uncharacterized protein n=1 Tax=Pleurodeles waltl TaxID=8319 RepID=A0AAV7WKK9_PLEWA|nr:hypothetical protein NDU88_000889 [Pleurodeles waltl]
MVRLIPNCGLEHRKCVGVVEMQWLIVAEVTGPDYGVGPQNIGAAAIVREREAAAVRVPQDKHVSQGATMQMTT